MSDTLKVRAHGQLCISLLCRCLDIALRAVNRSTMRLRGCLCRTRRPLRLRLPPRTFSMLCSLAATGPQRRRTS
eukprot:scaffold93694_cov19-Prasinocladus_malaysianus.AAC.1